MVANFESSPHVRKLGSLIGHQSGVSAIAWSPDGKGLASASSDGTLNLWPSIDAEARPRPLRKMNSNSPVTALSWSHNSRYVAIGTSGGEVEIWNVRTGRCERVENVQGPVWSTAWARRDLRLAFAGSDLTVHFRNYEKGFARPVAETGIGHAHPVLRFAWTPNGGSLIAATAGGTIGVWSESAVDNQLRNALSIKGASAHDDEVLALGTSSGGQWIGSGGRDCWLRLWSADTGLVVSTVELDEPVLDLAFAPGDELLVVQCFHSIRVFRVEGLGEIASYAWLGTLDEPRTSVAIDHIGSRLAAVDCQSHAVVVWQVDFRGLLRYSQVARNRLRAASITVLGSPESGKSNLARLLTRQAFEPEAREHGFEVHRMRLEPVPNPEGDRDLREISFWDLPSQKSAVLAGRVHAADSDAILLVLSAAPGTHAAENEERWKQELRHWSMTSDPERKPFLVAINRTDNLTRVPQERERREIEAALGLTRIYFTNARTSDGIDELLEVLPTLPDWEQCAVSDSTDVFMLVAEFVAGQKRGGRLIGTFGQFHDLFTHSHAFLGRHAPSEAEFRAAIQVLQTLGAVHCFEHSEQVLLDTSHYHTYLSALVHGAEKDPERVGRLPLEQAELGRGSQLELSENRRLGSAPQERRLLAALIDELVDRAVAQKISTDGSSYLVFPSSLDRHLDVSSLGWDTVASCRFAGAVEDVFSSLVVRLLGLETHYPKAELWRNAATFAPLSGGGCGLSIDVMEDQQGHLSILFDRSTSPSERGAFCGMVRRHVEQRGRQTEWIERQARPIAEGGAALPQVFLRYRRDDEREARNVRHIADQLLHHKIQPWLEERELTAGDTREKRKHAMENSKVAAFFLSGRLDEAERRDLDILSAVGCRVIPVILPYAKDTFRVPDVLKGIEEVDFRDLADPVERLVAGVRQFWTEAARSGPGRTSTRRHVFVSYLKEDREDVEALVRSLDKSGHPVWWDARLVPGGDWKEQIRTAIAASYAFILCLSRFLPARLQAGIFPELDQAIEQQLSLVPRAIYLVPIRLSPCRIPDVQIDATRTLSSLQFFDHFDRADALSGLLEALDTAREQRSASATQSEGTKPLAHGTVSQSGPGVVP